MSVIHFLVILWCLPGQKGSAHFTTAIPLSSDMWGNCCVVCVRQPFSPKILTVTPYLMNTHWVLGNVQDTLTVPAHTHACGKGKLATGARMCFSDCCGWHSSETKSVNSNSDVDFFQENCKRNCLHFVCLATNYERTHNNDLTVHAETLPLPRTFTSALCHWFLSFFEALRAVVTIFPRIWSPRG